jgi:DNA-binding NtrC family response regulator
LAVAKVLVIDDGDKLCEVCLPSRGPGHAVVTASDGVTALQVYDPHRPDLVITDVGAERARRLGVICPARAVRPDVKIIAMSGFLIAHPG